MKFIALLIVLALIQYWGSSRFLHKDQWYESLLDGLADFRMPAELSLFIARLGPAALLAWLLSLAENWLFGLFGLALNVLLLLYCFGRRDYAGLLKHYRDAPSMLMGYRVAQFCRQN